MNLTATPTAGSRQARTKPDQSRRAGSAPQQPKAPLAAVNLLPPEIGERERLQQAQLVMATVLVAALVAVGGLTVWARQSKSSAEKRLEAVTADYQQWVAKKAAFADVPAQRQRLADAERMLSLAMGDEVSWSSYLAQLQKSVPQGVWLTQMSASLRTSDQQVAPQSGSQTAVALGSGTIDFSGKALGYDAIANWIDVLNSQKGNVNAFLLGSQRSTGDPRIVEFTSRVVITPAMQTGRFK